MIPWKLLDTAIVPGTDSEMRLYQRDTEFSIRVARRELMNSRAHSSERGFSELGCARIRDRERPRVLIGGLGMGFSLRAALEALPRTADVVVAELVPAVVRWNREQLGHLAEHPLRDKRVTVHEVDVARVLREAKGAFDLIMLDVDNGPEGLTREANDWIYGRAGLGSARSALRPHGVLGFWSATPDRGFVRRLQQAGFEVEERKLKAANGRGSTHTLWFASVSRGRTAQ